MNRAFSQALVRPNLPLRRPATGPSSPLLTCPLPTLQEQYLVTKGVMDGIEAGAIRKVVVQNCGNASSPQQLAGSVTTQQVKMCNYCSLPGKFRCTRCNKTCYCSVACQAQDWIAHRHICKPSVPEDASEKSKFSTAMACGNGPGPLQTEDVYVEKQSKRMYRKDLRKDGIYKGAEIQGKVIDMKSPDFFIVYSQSEDMIQSLKNITKDLQKCYGNALAQDYKPEVGEICAVKFSVDRTWYRAEIQTVDVTRMTASVFYIDFGNEENATFDNIQPLSESIDVAPAFALKCCVAGVKPLTGSWTGECTSAVRKLIADKTLSIKVINIMDGDLLAVDFSVGRLGMNISGFLIKQEYAVQEGAPGILQAEHSINSLKMASFENFKSLSEGKNENSDARPPEPLSQRVGDSFLAVVTHLQSPSEILCQKIENARDFEQLQLKLREHCTNASVSEDFRPAPGTICCSLFSEDNQWYRAEVLAYSSERVVCVGYIDFGNSEEVGLNRLRPISQDLLTMATQAIPCSLAGIKCVTETWSDEAAIALKRIVYNRFIRVEILGQKARRALVSMTDESSDPQANVAEQLVNMGYAVVESAEKNTTVQAPISEMPSLSSPIEKMKWTYVQLPVDDQKVSLVISTMKSLDEFYCLIYSKADEQHLNELSYDLMRHCETEKAPFNPTVGEPCCALFTDDARWYRAMVLELNAKGKAQVCFVDYGNLCEVDEAHLKSITPNLLKLPFQAVRCWISGIEPVEGQWSKEAMIKFQNFCASQPLSGRVQSVTEKGYGLELEFAGQSIGAVLISERLAKSSGEVKQPPPQLATPTNQADDLLPLKVDQSPPEKEQEDVSSISGDSCVSNGSYPFTWKTLELSCRDSFKPRVAAVINPSLFYIMNPGQVNVEGLNTVMVDLERYCKKQQVPNQCCPLPGEACCAQFSGDKNWYRAVVLEVTSKHAHIIYADYGNMETVPVSCILPISKKLLQHPFQIVRCALAGKEHFPKVWPTEVLELFVIQLSGGIQATLQSFDGTSNLLNLADLSDQTDINSIILGALQKRPLKPDLKQPPIIKKEENPDQIEEQNGNANKMPDQAQMEDVEKPVLKDQAPAVNGIPKFEEPENVSKMATPENTEMAVSSSKDDTASQFCCCLELKQKLGRIEEVILFLGKQAGFQK